MSRLHSSLIALVLGSVAAAGLFAGVKTVRLGQKVSAAKHPVAARELASRQAKLDRWSRSLRAQQAKRPPALPKVPKFAPVPSPQPAASPVSPAAAVSPVAPQVRYVRPKPVLKYQRAAGKSTTTATSTQRSWSDDAGTAEGSDSSADSGSTGGDD